MKTVIIVLLLLSSFLISGQGRVSGILVEKVSQTPVEYASVAVINQDNQKHVSGTITDSLGYAETPWPTIHAIGRMTNTRKMLNGAPFMNTHSAKATCFPLITPILRPMNRKTTNTPTNIPFPENRMPKTIRQSAKKHKEAALKYDEQL